MAGDVVDHLPSRVVVDAEGTGAQGVHALFADRRQVGQHRVGEERLHVVVAGAEQEHAVAGDGGGQVFPRDELEVRGARHLARQRLRQFRHLEAEGLEQACLGAGLAADGIAAGDVVADHADRALRRRDGRGDFGGVGVEALDGGLRLAFQAGVPAQLGSQFLPAVFRVVDHQRRYALRLQLRTVWRGAVGAGGGGDQQVRILGDHRFDVEAQVAVEHLDATLVGDLRPLREEALGVGQATWRGGGAGHQRCVHRQQDAGDARGGGDDPRRLRLPGRGEGGEQAQGEGE